MNLQHQVVLSLGSNQGNRLKNIELCLKKIHQEVGAIIKISKLYETPSWGFDGENFYNCALVLHSSKTAHQILDQVLEIEKKMGRIRKSSLGYQSRIIDVDLIAFDEEIINSATLQIPHPLLQNRKFVLLPFQDLDLDWMHPVSKKTITELLQLTTDMSSCIVIRKLRHPFEKKRL